MCGATMSVTWMYKLSSVKKRGKTRNCGGGNRPAHWLRQLMIDLALSILAWQLRQFTKIQITHFLLINRFIEI